MFISSFCLFDYAVKAHRLTEGTFSDLSAEPRWALPAVVFSAASLEAFINEVGELATRVVDTFGLSEDGRVAQWAELFQTLEANRASTARKFRSAKRFLTDAPFDEGASPFQDFRLLMDLRNGLMHMGPTEEHVIVNGRLVVVESDLLKPCRSRHLLVEPAPGGDAWFQHIMTEPMARWACNTTSDMVRSIREGVSDAVLRERLHAHFQDHFRRLD